MARWPIQSCLSLNPLATSPISPQFPSHSQLLSLISLLTIGQILHLCLTALPLSNCNKRWTSRNGGCRWSDTWSPSSGRWAPCSHSKVTPTAQFFAVFGVVRPPFMVGPPVLKWALHLLQNCAPLDRWIFAVQKPVIIHTVTSIAFSCESGKFREVKPPKV